MHVIFKDYKYSRNSRMSVQVRSNKKTQNRKNPKSKSKPKIIVIPRKNHNETDSAFGNDFDRSRG